MTTSAAGLVRKLWQYCNILRDDGMSYPDYVEQLTYLLFLKMADEQGDRLIPQRLSWKSFEGRSAVDLYEHYSLVLRELGARRGTLGLVFRNARNKIKDPAKLRLLIVDLIGQTSWSELSPDVKGDAYEGLLEKNAKDSKSGAGQYFTPRPLIDAIVACVRPSEREIVCDPACGTGGFLLAANEYIRRHPQQRVHPKVRPRTRHIRGVELVEEVARLATMNLLLHDMGSASDKGEPPIRCEDSLSRPSSYKADVVLTNPPFGTKGSVTMSRSAQKGGDDFTAVRRDFPVKTANKQLNFVQHVLSMLKPEGRAAIVVPDNVLFEAGAAAIIRRRLLENCYVHTLLRLPTGLFYAQGVKANVLFFDAQKPPHGSKLWVYNLRGMTKLSLKTKPLQRADLDDFVDCFHSPRRQPRASAVDRGGGAALWRPFAVTSILEDDTCSLDLNWNEHVAEPKSVGGNRLNEMAALIAADLRCALDHVAAMGSP